ACGVPGDGTGLPPCVSDSFCIDNRCSGPCSQDAHCAADEACLVGDEWPVDSDGDLAYNDYVNIDLCVPWPNESPNTLCLTDSDCAEGHHCEFRIKGTGEGTERIWEVEYACKKDDPDQLRFPAACTAENKNDCVGNCLFAGGAVTGLCTEPCASAADCPAFSWGGQNYEGVCYSYAYNSNMSLEEEDDLYVPHCWFASPLASLTSCEDTRQCDAPGIDGGGEFCRAHAIARNPSEPVVVEHLCRDSSWSLAEEPLKEVGEACNTYTQCRTRSCLAGGPNGGYCGSLCLVDSDCKSDNGIDGLQCVNSVVLEREDPALSGVTKACLLVND
ncbi:MAG: hypothetical protein VX938_12725, partial [Myxococcota bacterium]|nr:hypothetical protein [Myxococcota bacterium]